MDNFLVIRSALAGGDSRAEVRARVKYISISDVAIERRDSWESRDDHGGSISRGIAGTDRQIRHARSSGENCSRAASVPSVLHFSHVLLRDGDPPFISRLAIFESGSRLVIHFPA